MVIIWRRWGPIGLIFLVLGFLLWVGLSALARQVLGTADAQGWWNVLTLVIGFAAGASANWLFATKVVEPKLDRPDAFPPLPPSSIFFLTLRQWTWAIAAIGVVFLTPNVLETLGII